MIGDIDLCQLVTLGMKLVIYPGFCKRYYVFLITSCKLPLLKGSTEGSSHAKKHFSGYIKLRGTKNGKGKESS